MKEDTIGRRMFMKQAALTGGGFGMLAAGAAGAQDEYGAAPAAPQDSAPAAPIDLPEGTKVPRKPLGKTGREVPILLMGCSQKFDPKYDRRLHMAYKLGVDYLDTAQGYANGQSHKTLAPFLEQVGRKNAWVTSKVHLEGRVATPENFVKHLEENCLPDLATDYLDMFFMHMVKDEALLEPEYIKMGDDLKKSGKAQLFGFSCHDGNVVELMNKAARVGGIDAIMFRYNFRQYGDMELNKSIDACKAAGIGLIAMKTQASVPEDLEKVIEFKSAQNSLAQAKIKAVWADDRIDSLVSSMQNVQQVQENVAAACSNTKLSMNEFVQLNRLAALTAAYACNGCSHLCEAKVQGNLKIAQQMRYLMYHDSYGDTETARALYAQLSPEERDFDGVDLSGAMAVCPQKINIAQRLADARAHLMA
ncbi:MAG: aldo/keto reductase [Candidatus Hydrogenedentes bacterium]|nr:aldo/keto reductase [Candidatus Hydrogenedentota bacterium]